MPSKTSTAKYVDSCGYGLEIEFELTGDRFEHVIFGIAGDQRVALLRTIESATDQTQSRFPAFQEIVAQQDREGRDILMLVGKAGDRYWSATVTGETDHKFSLLRFELACRGPQPHSDLCALYEAGSMGELTFANERATCSVIADALIQIIGGVIETSVASGLVPTATVSQWERDILIRPTLAPHVTDSQATRFAYELQMTRRV
ncbi:hypothetical protein [Botrimarina mediterranea]|uniref:Uncharacterized protein n=1 Tax=Botrimarina mediterranea TaxID=2528022 RepID=A0A518K2M6_9BACT|nr:hypothetical protein [Botrimarina mediterranea]QDV72066.1 hypothetical protein Spa11_02360 [Botrimarina mediterranea]